jgi:hypothetical protein
MIMTATNVRRGLHRFVHSLLAERISSQILNIDLRAVPYFGQYVAKKLADFSGL